MTSEPNKKKGMTNILITGANGFIGRRLLDDLSDRPHYEVTGCSLHDDICPGSDAYRFLQTDLCDLCAVESLMEEIHPAVVINTAALSATDYCETHRREADRLNIEATAILAACCRRYGARFIHLSTDFVFDGTADHLYSEDDEPRPVNYYGETKLKGERLAAALCPDHAIVRVEVVYGSPLPGQHGNIAQLVANRIRNDEEVFVVSDQRRTPTYVGDVSHGIEQLIAHPHRGIYHLCGKDEVSIADIAYRVADILGEGHSLIRPLTTAEMQEKTPRPLRSGMSIEKARRDLGYEPLPLEEGLRRMFL